MGLARLPFARARQQRYMPDAVTLTHAGVSPLATVCRFYPDGTLHTAIAGSEQVPRFRFYLPYATDVVVGDQLTVAGAVWAVTQVLDPQSFDTATLCYAYQLTDSAGTPVYLRPNATVTVTRQDGTAVYPTARAVHIADSKATMERLMPYGEVGDRMLLDLLAADYKRGDVVTIVTFGSSTQPIGYSDYEVHAQPSGNSSSGVEWLEVWLRAHGAAPNG